MKKEVIEIPGFRETLDERGRRFVPLSKVIRAGGFVFVSGMPPQDPATGDMIGGDIKAQTTRVLENLKMALEAAGTSMDKVVKATVFCSNAGYFLQINEVYREYFPHDPPTRTFVTVGSWPLSFDIEIECIAIA